MARKKKFGGVTVAGVKQKEQKNWGAQILMVLALGGALLGGTLAFAAGSGTTAGITALGVCIASLIVLLATAVRAVGTWDF
jgi:peptidoglycan/LPS O-acetylase OafA/YrhL